MNLREICLNMGGVSKHMGITVVGWSELKNVRRIEDNWERHSQVDLFK